jgi:protein disulfide-isomerase A6
MTGIFTFAAVDCDDQNNRGLCQEFQIEGFPSLKFMKPSQGKVDALGTFLYGNVDVDYVGPRTAKGLTDFAKQNMENLVVRVTDDTIDSFLRDNVFLL